MTKTAEELKKQKRYQTLAIILFILIDLGMIGLVFYYWIAAGPCPTTIFLTIVLGYSSCIFTLVILACLTQDNKFIEIAVKIMRPLERMVNKLSEQEDKYFKGTGVFNGFDQWIYFTVFFVIMFTFCGDITAIFIDYVSDSINALWGADQTVCSILLLMLFAHLIGMLSGKVVHVIFGLISEKQIIVTTENNIKEVKKLRDVIGQERPDCDRECGELRQLSKKQVENMKKFDALCTKLIHKEIMMIMLLIFTAAVILFPDSMGLNTKEQSSAVNAVTLVTLLITVIQNISAWNTKLQMEKEKYVINAVAEEKAELEKCIPESVKY